MPTTNLVRPNGVPPSSVDQLTVTVIEDPLRVRHGVPISSPYVETFWLSHLGPSAICLLRLFDRFTRHRPDHRVTLSVPELGTMIGTPGGGAKNSVITTRINRLTRFGAARWETADHTQLTVWSHLDVVPLRLRSRWPAWLVDAHTQAITEQTAG